MKNTDNQDKELNKLNDNDMDKVSGGYTKKGLLGIGTRTTYCDACGRKNAVPLSGGRHICFGCIDKLKDILGADNTVAILGEDKVKIKDVENKNLNK